MSYMRGDIYAWTSDRFIHLWVTGDSERVGVLEKPENFGRAGGIHIDIALFDALVLYRHAELVKSPKEMRRAVKQAKKMAGNIGSCDWLESIGSANALRAKLFDPGTEPPL